MMAANFVAEISHSDLRGLKTPSTAFITDVKHLASYNWIEKPTPTIAVPGVPHLWSAPQGPQRLEKDSGLIYIDQNAARHPDSPLEPLFCSLFLTDPLFNIQSAHVVTDRSNILKLLSFVHPSMAKNTQQTCAINVEMVKDAAILSRNETATQTYISPRDFRGFGHEFEKKYTN